MRASRDFHIRPLDEQHDRIGFACGVESLDRYLKTQAGQDVRRKANAVFVLSERDQPACVLGYYTLCAMALSQREVPEAARREMEFVFADRIEDVLDAALPGALHRRDIVADRRLPA